MPIRLLPDDVISQIAAGEVVERPASVVKELVENALDASASHVIVEANKGGHRLIRVSDNGTGIATDEVELSVVRHATSKLESANDLSHITTLGFRGEALASIGAVSRLSLTTRHIDEEVGTALQVEGGILLRNEPVGAPAGTVVTVENLFFNTPARMKFMKSEHTEKRHITTIVTRYAMAYPHVQFTLKQDGRELFRSSGSGQLGDAVMNVLGLDNFKRMIAVEGEEPIKGGLGEVRVWGFVSEPGLHRNDRSRILLFVNGRAVQDASLSHAVKQAYHTLLMKGRYPFAVLMIEVPPEFVDVNVHPTKAEVRFQKSDAVFVAIQRTVRQTVIGFSGTREMRGSHHSRYTELLERENVPDWAVANTGNVPQTQLDLHLDLRDPGQFAAHRPAHDEDLSVQRNPTEIPEGMGRPEKPRTLPMLRVVGQIAAAYIVAEGPAGMYLIDQHAAHERIMYEEYMEAYQQKDLVVQHTLNSQTIDLPPNEARLVEEKLDVLQAVGFMLEPFGTNTFRIRSIPAMLAGKGDPVELVLELLEELEDDLRKPGERSIEGMIIQQVCKRASVKAGQILSFEEMQGLIRQLERCASPHTCPHGRPTMIHMSADQLAREFGRLG